MLFIYKIVIYQRNFFLKPKPRKMHHEYLTAALLISISVHV